MAVLGAHARTLRPKEYFALHRWVRTSLGTSFHCDNCGSTTKKMYHWANVSGKYNHSLKDWKRLCVSCHSRFDYGNMCKARLHRLEEWNTYITPSNGVRQCLACRRSYTLTCYYAKERVVA